MEEVAEKKKTSAGEKYKVGFEILGWIAILFLAPFFFSDFYDNHAHLPSDYGTAAADRITHLGVTYTIGIFSIILAFLIIFYLVYSRLPFQHIRENRKKRLEEEAWDTVDTEGEEDEEKEAIIQLSDNLWLAKGNSEKIYGRSNTFLFVGAFTAIAGVIFFYVQFQGFADKTTNATLSLPYIFELNLQRFGSLIFIEGIAFFFLRQYSNAMEDFRYYEAIKRQRENQYTIGLLYKDETVDFVKQFVESCEFSSNPNKLSKDETTQLLEAKKVIGADPDVLQKFLDLVKLTRK